MVYKIKVPPWYAVQMGSVADSRNANIQLLFNMPNTFIIIVMQTLFFIESEYVLYKMVQKV